MTRTFIQAIAALLLTFLLPSAARADLVFCVSNATQLAQALTQASASSEPSIYIRLRNGIYHTSPQTGAFVLIQQHSDQFVEISGGWSGENNTCATRSPNPVKTALVGEPSTPALGVVVGVNITNPGQGVTNSTVHVQGLSLLNANFTPHYEIDQEAFDNGYYDDMYRTVSGCLNASVIGASNQMKLERLYIRNCNSPNNGDASGVIENHGATLNMNNIVVSGGKGKANGGMRVLTIDFGISRLTQFTVINNEYTCGSCLPTGGLALRAFFGGTVYLSNSVLYGAYNANFNAVDLESIAARRNYIDNVWQTGSKGTIRLNRVHRGHYRESGPANTIFVSDITSGYPGFSGQGPYLKADSPLVDSGIVNPPGGTGIYDAAGEPRVQGARVDVGAIEYSPTNQAPSMGNASIQVAYSTLPGTLLHTFVASDDGQPVPGTLTYSLQSVVTPPGRPNPFALASDGRLTLVMALPAGQTGIYTVTAKACDAAPLCATGVLVVNVVAHVPGEGGIFSDGFE